jgi:asparagine synthase (glutamine-hydrolysing)
VDLGSTTSTAKAIPEAVHRAVLAALRLSQPAAADISTVTGWLPGEVLEHTCSSGRGIIIGQCVAAAHLVSARVEEALESGDLRCLMSLPGAYSAVLAMRSEVVLVADAVGQFPLYYRRTSHEVVFGTRAELVAAATNASCDQVVLAMEIACPQAFPALSTRSVYDQVHQLEPGTALHMSAAGVHTVPVVALTHCPDRTLDDTAAELREVLTAAVAARVSLGTLLSSDFSGGVDSTSLAFLAARHTDVLPAVTFTPCGSPIKDDLAAAVALARLDRRLEHHVVSGDERHLPYQQPFLDADAPHPSALHLGPLRARLSTVAELGSALHLVGEGGDHVLTAPHAYLADLARQREFGQLWRHCHAWARLRHRSPASLLAHSLRLAATTSRRGLLVLARQLERRQPTLDSWESRAITVTGNLLCDWLTPAAGKALAAQLACAAQSDLRHAGDQAATAALRSACRAQQAVREVAAGWGIAAHAPFLDPEVARVCLSLPAWRRADLRSAKPLLRQAMTGLIPDAVFTRKTKGDYTTTAHLGTRQAIQALRTLLTDPLSADLGLIEPGPVREALRRASQGMPTPWAALNQVLAVETWLRDATNRQEEGTSNADVHRSEGGTHDDRRERTHGGVEHQNGPVARVERNRGHGVPGTGAQR